jgi:capsular exopolysaccharide synthesis family protein
MRAIPTFESQPNTESFPVPYTGSTPFTEVLPPEANAAERGDPRRTIQHLLYLLWCWRGRFLAAFGTVVLFGGVSLFVLPISYTARALVMVGAGEPDPLVVSQNAVREPRNRDLEIEGEIELIGSLSSLRRAAQRLELAQRPEFQRAVANENPSTVLRLRDVLFGGEGHGAPITDPTDIIAADLKQHLKVERIGRSAIVQISFVARDPKLAAEVANAVAGNAAANEEFLTGLTLTERVGFDLLKAWIVSPAVVPQQPSSPNFRLVILVTIVLGGGAGIAVILLSDFFASQKVLNTDQIRRRGGRTLALIPDFGPMNDKRLPASTLFQPQVFGDSIAALQASLVPLIPRTEPTCLVLLFASALPFEGKSTTVAALAASLAKSGARVLVVDADLRAPTLHLAFGISCEPGLADLLDADCNFDQLIRSDAASSVCLLPAGRSRFRPVDVLSSTKLQAAIQKARSSFDFILIDAPPVLGVPDTRLLVPSIDYCVFVARWGKTGWHMVNQALLAMTDAGARIAGITISRVNVKEMERYGFVEPMLYGYPYGRASGGSTTTETGA